MEARLTRAAITAAVLFVSLGADYPTPDYPTPNFLVKAPTVELARQIAAAAEKYRHDLAVEWLGKPMPNWSRPCTMTVRVGPNLGAGGATTFVFDRGEVFGWRMTIQGSRQRIFDSVLPHEITHMVLASHFRRPLPRWADEGAATSEEDVSERKKHHRMLIEFLRNGRGIAFNRMLAMKEYPRDIMPLYAQGFSVAEFLIRLGGKRKYLEFLGDGMETGQWSAAIARHYSIADAGKLQNTWLAWIRQGCPPISQRPAHPVAAPSAAMVAAAATPGRPLATATPERSVVPASVTTPIDAGRDARPESYSIYQTPAERSKPYAPGSVIAATGPIRVAACAEPKELPSSGWYAMGTSSPRPSPPRQPSPAQAALSQAPPPVVPSPMIPPPIFAPAYSQVTRPQPYERPRQMILEGCLPGG